MYKISWRISGEQLNYNSIQNKPQLVELQRHVIFNNDQSTGRSIIIRLHGSQEYANLYRNRTNLVINKMSLV